MTTLRILLAGPCRAVVAVTQALADAPHEPLHAVWSLRESAGRCEIRDGARTTVASTWGGAVRLHLSAPAPLCSVRVVRPWGVG